MSSMSGYINYIKYTAGSTKGATMQGDVFNDPFRLGKVDPQYTSSRVTDTYTEEAATTNFTMAWKPLFPVQSVLLQVEPLMSITATVQSLQFPQADVFPAELSWYSR